MHQHQTWQLPFLHHRYVTETLIFVNMRAAIDDRGLLQKGEFNIFYAKLNFFFLIAILSMLKNSKMYFWTNQDFRCIIKSFFYLPLCWCNTIKKCSFFSLWTSFGGGRVISGGLMNFIFSFALIRRNGTKNLILHSQSQTDLFICISKC